MAQCDVRGMRLEVREKRGWAITDKAKAHGEVEMPMIKRKVKRQKGERTVDTPTWGCARAGTVEAWVKQVKHVGNEEEASESMHE